MAKLIFVHGSGNTSMVWKYQVQYFPAAEAIDLPGHLSPGEPCTSVEDYVAWLRSYTLEREHHAPILVGHSLGGAIVQMYALEHSEDVKAIILAGTGAKLRVARQYLSMMQDGVENPSIWLRDFVEPQYSHIEPGLKKKLLAETAKVGAKVQLNDFICCDKFDILEKVNQIEVPALVLCGSEDVMTPPKYSSYLAASIEGAKLSVVDGGTHYFFAEKPEVVNQAIEQFLLGL
jgi:pimeloyl-ACP methyl ester carboxylesterase